MLRQDVTRAQQHLERWLAIFPDHFYLELIRTGKPEQERYILDALKLAEQFAVPIVATNDVRFIHAEDYEAHEARVCIHEGPTLDDPKRSPIY